MPALFAVLALSLVPFTAVAAEDVDAEFAAGNWGTDASLGVNLLQSYYTRNWNGGDKGSVVWNATLDARAQKQLNDQWHWYNSLNLAFGQNHQQARDSDGGLFWKRPDKTTDHIKAESLLRYTRSELDPFISVRFESQFLDQTDPYGRELSLNPLEFFESVGVSRMLIDQEARKLMGRLGFTLHQSSRDIFLAVPPADEASTESVQDGGVELTLNYKSDLLQDRVEYTGQLRFYKPFFYSAKSDVEDLGAQALVDLGLDGDLPDHFLTTDIDFENTFKANITKVINVQLYVRWVYDKYDSTVKPVVRDGVLENPGAVAAAVRKSGQLKQTMSIGMGYTF